MSANTEFINELVADNTDLVMYSDDNEFAVLSVNYKIAEKAFLAARGRAFNEDELQEVKSAFAARAMKDKEFVETTAGEACQQHQGLVMTGQTLDAGVEAFTEAVTIEVREALVTRGISCTFTVAGHPESSSKLSRYVAAAETCEA